MNQPRRLLERIPQDKLSWKPHPKSMSLGQLAIHVASIPGDLSQLAQLDQFDASNATFEPPSPNSLTDVLGALEVSIQRAEHFLLGLSEETARGNWRLTLRGKNVFTIPRAELLRSLLFNHWYHHAGSCPSTCGCWIFHCPLYMVAVLMRIRLPEGLVRNLPSFLRGDVVKLPQL